MTNRRRLRKMVFMWFEIVYGVEGDNLHTTEIWADNLDDAFDYALVFAHE